MGKGSILFTTHIRFVDFHFIGKVDDGNYFLFYNWKKMMFVDKLHSTPFTIVAVLHNSTVDINLSKNRCRLIESRLEEKFAFYIFQGFMVLFIKLFKRHTWEIKTFPFYYPFFVSLFDKGITL